MTIRNALVYGAGMMGKNIAWVLTADPTVQVFVYDVRPVDIRAALAESFQLFIDAGLICPADAKARTERVTFLNQITHEIGQGLDLVIECVYEDMTLKRTTFAQLEELCRPDTIFCTNTSVMSPTEISQDLIHKDRFMGTHFWNPAHLIPLVEVVMSERTTPALAQVVVDFLIRCGKTAVLCQKDVPGFIANRMQHALWREAISIVEQGIADAATVDAAVKNSFGLRLAQLGPLENADMAGLDLTWNIHDYVLQHLEDSHRPSPLLTSLKEDGKLGFKSGEGFRTWTPEEAAQVSQDLNRYLFDAYRRRTEAN